MLCDLEKGGQLLERPRCHGKAGVIVPTLGKPRKAPLRRGSQTGLAVDTAAGGGAVWWRDGATAGAGYTPRRGEACCQPSCPPTACLGLSKGKREKYHMLWAFLTPLAPARSLSSPRTGLRNRCPHPPCRDRETGTPRLSSSGTVFMHQGRGV